MSPETGIFDKESKHKKVVGIEVTSESGSVIWRPEYEDGSVGLFENAGFETNAGADVAERFKNDKLAELQAK